VHCASGLFISFGSVLTRTEHCARARQRTGGLAGACDQPPSNNSIPAEQNARRTRGKRPLPTIQHIDCTHAPDRALRARGPFGTRQPPGLDQLVVRLADAAEGGAHLEVASPGLRADGLAALLRHERLRVIINLCAAAQSSQAPQEDQGAQHGPSAGVDVGGAPGDGTTFRLSELSTARAWNPELVARRRRRRAHGSRPRRGGREHSPSSPIFGPGLTGAAPKHGQQRLCAEGHSVRPSHFFFFIGGGAICNRLTRGKVSVLRPLRTACLWAVRALAT
jgi:hypothetical protein